MVVLLVKNDTSKYNLDSVRAGMTGAAPLTEETSLALQKKFPRWIFGQGACSTAHQQAKAYYSARLLGEATLSATALIFTVGRLRYDGDVYHHLALRSYAEHSWSLGRSFGPECGGKDRLARRQAAASWRDWRVMDSVAFQCSWLYDLPLSLISAELTSGLSQTSATRRRPLRLSTRTASFTRATSVALTTLDGST